MQCAPGVGVTVNVDVGRGVRVGVGVDVLVGVGVSVGVPVGVGDGSGVPVEVAVAVAVNVGVAAGRLLRSTESVPSPSLAVITSLIGPPSRVAQGNCCVCFGGHASVTATGAAPTKQVPRAG
jgi:hypothetical protein